MAPRQSSASMGRGSSWARSTYRERSGSGPPIAISYGSSTIARPFATSFATRPLPIHQPTNPPAHQLQSLGDLVPLQLEDARRERRNEKDRAHRPDGAHRHRDVGELRRRPDDLLA